MQEKLYRLEELTEATGVSPRNIRYYTTQGLLPAPDARGRFALYTTDHLRRLRMIQRLKDSFLPLEVIRLYLAQTTDAQMDSLLAEDVRLLPPEASDASKETASSPLADSAADYISRVLAKQVPPGAPPAMAVAARSPSPPDVPSESWERVTLAPGVELHTRRMDTFVQKLIAFAKHLHSSNH